jgi:hypothetical protein
MRKNLKWISLLALLIVSLAIVPTGATTYTLTVNTDPQGIGFTLDGTPYTTQWSGSVAPGNYTIVMPFRTTALDGRDYYFEWWEDDSTCLTRVVEVTNESVSVTATYGFAYNITTIYPQNIYVDPPETEDPYATTHTVDIVVSPGYEEVVWYSMETHTVKEVVVTTIPTMDVWGAQFSLTYEPLVLNGLSYGTNTAWLASDGGTPFTLEGPGFDDENGQLGLFGMSLAETGDPWVSPDIYADQVLATVSFNVVGSGVSGIVLGDDTKLKDTYGNDFERTLAHGTFRNANAEMYMGPAKGGKIWPAWKHGAIAEPNILYGRCTNLGDGGVYIRIRFVVSSTFGTDEVLSNVVWVGPGEDATVSAVYTPPGPGAYVIKGVIDFMYDGLAFIDYTSMEGMLGGDGITREIGTKFWVG